MSLPSLLCCCLFLAAAPAQAQDTLSFTGYLGEHTGYFVQLDLPGDLSSLPDGPFEGLSVNDTLVNLPLWGAFLVPRVPGRLVKLRSDYYVPLLPIRRKGEDGQAALYNNNAAVLRSFAAKHYLDRTFTILYGEKTYRFPAHFAKVQLRFVVAGSQEITLLTEHGRSTKSYRLVRLLEVRDAP